MRCLAIGVAALAAGCVPLERPQEVVRVDLRAPWLDPDRPVLRVGPRVITRGEAYRRVVERLGSGQILSGIARDELLRMGAESMGIGVSDEEVERGAEEKFDAWCDEFADAEAMRRELAREGLTREEVRAAFREETSHEILVAKVVSASRVIDDEALHDYYRDTYAQARVYVRHLAFPGGADEKETLKRRADEAVRRLRGAEAWDSVARDFLEGSGDDAAALGGDRGWIGERAELPEDLKSILFALGAGEAGEPVWEEGFGYHVFSVTQKAAPEPYAQCREKMAGELRNEPPRPGEIQDVLAKLGEKFPVEIIGAAPPREAPAGAGVPERSSAR